MPTNEERTTERLIMDAQWGRKDLMICAEATRQAGMRYIAETLVEAADIIEKLVQEVERLKKYENAVDQIMKPDADKMMGRT